MGQPFEAWQYGPVNRVVYAQLKKFGSQAITGKLTRVDTESGEFVDAHADFDEETREFLNNVFDYYSGLHPYRLIDLTHEAGSPWDVVWRQAERSAVPGMWISDDLILQWFEETGGRMYGRGEQGVNA